jgi:hypothetical protein
MAMVRPSRLLLNVGRTIHEVFFLPPFIASFYLFQLFVSVNL